MARYLKKVQGMLRLFDGIDFQRILKSENARIDFLSRLTTAKAVDMTSSTCWEVLDLSSHDEAEVVMATIIEPS